VESDTVNVAVVMVGLFSGWVGDGFSGMCWMDCYLHVEFSLLVKRSDLMLTASLFNDAFLTINYSPCVISGFHRHTNDICSLLDVWQHRLMVADCLTLEDETENLSRNDGN
jgi:hypothetical protein